MSAWTPTPLAPRFGITSTHWRMMDRFASDTRKILVIRGGKERAVSYIAQNFPAKEQHLSDIKVDPDIGLLRLPSKDTDKCRKAAHKLGYYILEKRSLRSDFQAVRYNYDTKKTDVLSQFDYQPNSLEWAQSDLIIDPNSGLPVTSDYDIGAIITRDDPRWGNTFLADKSKEKTNFTSPFTEQVVHSLNFRAAMNLYLNPLTDKIENGRPRFMHASQAQLSGSPVNDEVKGDWLVTFFGNGKTEAVHASMGQGQEYIQELLRTHTDVFENAPAEVLVGPWKNRSTSDET